MTKEGGPNTEPGLLPNVEYDEEALGDTSD